MQSVCEAEVEAPPSDKLHDCTPTQSSSNTSVSPDHHEFWHNWGFGPTTTLPFLSIATAIQSQVASNPQAIAACDPSGAQISYAQLNESANRLALELQRRGTRPGDNVALFLTRSIEMVIGIFAVLKTGAAYIPQSTGIATTTHLQHILDVTKATAVLTTSGSRPSVPAENSFCIEIDHWLEQQRSNVTHSDETTTEAVNAPVSPDSCCFVLFTSGTTGTPNGVRVTHRNICNILLTTPGNLGMGPGVKVAQLLNIAFDMAAWEVLGSLMNGATLLIRGKDFNQTASQANVIIATPSILATLDIEQCKVVKTVAVAGEPCVRSLADSWASRCDFYNCCGPTETTIVNTMQRHHPDARLLTIGKPTPNNTVYILDQNRKPCALGETGEMWAGGDCVTAGYLGNPKLTAERYAPDPYLGGDHTMFNTRDLGRWTDNGELEHLGRTDDQVKIRGFRVELDSVSAALESVPECARAATLKLNDRALVAFVEPLGIDPQKAAEKVAAQLPYYCVPERVYVLPQLPRTSRGKIDKRLLMQMTVNEPETTDCKNASELPA